MNSLFGDATSVMPTPETLAEVESLFSGSQRSPVPSLDIRRSGITADNAIPGLDIDPPAVEVEDGKPVLHDREAGEKGEGLGGWISNLVKRNKNGEESSNGGQYKRVGQGEDDEDEDHQNGGSKK